MGGGGGKKPKVPTLPTTPPPPEAPTAVDEGVRKAGDDARRQRAAATGRSDTILTGGSGLATGAQTQKKTLLGQ